MVVIVFCHLYGCVKDPIMCEGEFNDSDGYVPHILSFVDVEVEECSGAY